jgi:integrase
MTSPDTLEKYRERYVALSNRAAQDAAAPSGRDISIEGVAGWLYGRRDLLRASTWRQYRCALNYHCEYVLKMDDAAKAKLLEPLSVWPDEELLRKRRALPPATSSHVLHRVDHEEWEKLLKAIDDNNSKYNEPLKAYLRAGIVSGLRPHEWCAQRLVFIIDGEIAILIVNNCKYSDVRAHGPFRRLVYNTTNAADSIAAIKNWLEIVGDVLKGRVGKSRSKRWDAYCRALGNHMRLVCDKTWPRRKRHPAPYSVRHCFAALLKSKGVSKVEIAAMMGHAVDNTAADDYADPPRGGKSLPPANLPSAHSRDVANVRLGRTFDPNIFGKCAPVPKFR